MRGRRWSKVPRFNRTPSTVLSGVTPFERLRSCAPSYGHLRTFGCVCFVLLPSIERTKLSPRSAMCVFLGYSPEHKGYRCYDPASRRLRISRHVTFLEDTPYYSSSAQDLTFLQRPDSSTVQDPVSSSIVLPGASPPPSLPTTTSTTQPSPATTQSSAVPPESVASESASADASSGSPSLTPVPSSPVDVPAAPRRYPDRPPDRFAFSTVHTYTPLFQSFLAAIHSHQELRSYHEIVQHSHWHHAMSEKFSAL